MVAAGEHSRIEMSRRSGSVESSGRLLNREIPSTRPLVPHEACSEKPRGPYGGVQNPGTFSSVLYEGVSAASTAGELAPRFAAADKAPPTATRSRFYRRPSRRFAFGAAALALDARGGGSRCKSVPRTPH
ncbi:hypothetical protein MRX96_058322 [Rhipicephalus microplus]